MYYLATDRLTIFHYGETIEEQTITTGQPYLEWFVTEQELIDRLLEFNNVYVNYNTFKKKYNG
jgi:hypothetical protein